MGIILWIPSNAELFSIKPTLMHKNLDGDNDCPQILVQVKHGRLIVQLNHCANQIEFIDCDHLTN